MKYTFPADYDQRTCYLVAINASLIPIVAGLLRQLEVRGVWETEQDYELGYNAIAELESVFMKLCIDNLIESNDRLYRMLDTAIYGREYAIASLDPLTVEPAINPTHVLLIENQDSILGRMDTQRQLLENALNGTITPQYARPQGARDALDQILLALQEQQTLDPEILAKLAEIALLVA